MKTVNLKADMPTVNQALLRLERELAAARAEGFALIKVVHGYGSTGTGGEIRVAVQKRLQEMATRGEIGQCIFGENWAKSDEDSWKILCRKHELKQDRDLGKGNRGITVVVL